MPDVIRDLATDPSVAAHDLDEGLTLNDLDQLARALSPQARCISKVTEQVGISQASDGKRWFNWSRKLVVVSLASIPQRGTPEIMRSYSSKRKQTS